MAPPPQPSKHTQSCYNNNNNYLLWRVPLRLFKSDAPRREREKLHAALFWRGERTEKSYCRIFASNELQRG